MRKALIVFAKTPIPGTVKTRLSPPLSEIESAKLYRSFLLDSLDAYCTASELEGVDVRLYLTGEGDLTGVDSLPLTSHPQKGSDLGARMLRAFVETFAAGYGHAVVIGTDHPTLPLSFVEMAFEVLKEPFSISIGPSTDGGYFLLGMNEVYSSLFDMEFSHTAVFDETVERATETGANITVLPPWYDVDEVNSLKKLIAEMQAGVELGLRTQDSLEALLVAHPDLL